MQEQLQGACPPVILPSAQQQNSTQNVKTKVLLVTVIKNMNNIPLQHSQFYRIFSKYGEVMRILIFKKTDPWATFVEMDTVENAQKARQELNKSKILEDGIRINVMPSKKQCIEFQDKNPQGIGKIALQNGSDYKERDIKGFKMRKYEWWITQIQRKYETIYSNYTVLKQRIIEKKANAESDQLLNQMFKEDDNNFFNSSSTKFKNKRGSEKLNSSSGESDISPLFSQGSGDQFGHSFSSGKSQTLETQVQLNQSLHQKAQIIQKSNNSSQQSIKLNQAFQLFPQQKPLIQEQYSQNQQFSIQTQQNDQHSNYSNLLNFFPNLSNNSSDFDSHQQLRQSQSDNKHKYKYSNSLPLKDNFSANNSSSYQQQSENCNLLPQKKFRSLSSKKSFNQLSTNNTSEDKDTNLFDIQQFQKKPFQKNEQTLIQDLEGLNLAQSVYPQQFRIDNPLSNQYEVDREEENKDQSPQHHLGFQQIFIPQEQEIQSPQKEIFICNEDNLLPITQAPCLIPQIISPFNNIQKQIVNQDEEPYSDIDENTTPQDFQHPQFLKVTKKSKVIYANRFEYNNTTIIQIFNLFSTFGNISKIIFMHTKCSILIQYDNDLHSGYAKDYMNDQIFNGNIIKVFFSHHEEIFFKESHEKPADETYFEVTDDMNRFKPNSTVQINPLSDTLHVSNLRRDSCQYNIIKKLFDPFGKIKNFALMLEKDNKNMCFVKFETTAIAMWALSNTHNYRLNNRHLKVSFSKRILE